MATALKKAFVVGEEKQNKKQERFFDISLLRAIGILLVIISHATYVYADSFYKMTFAINGGSDFISKIAILLYTFHIPALVFAAGYIFYYRVNERGESDFESYFKKRAKRLLLPYFSVGLLFIIPSKFLLGIYQVSNIEYILKRSFLLAEAPGTLWFLFMLFNLSVVFYLFNNRIKGNPFTPLVFILTLLISPLFPDDLQLKNTLYYSLFFYFGYFVRQKHNWLDTKLKKYGPGFLVALILQLALFRAINGTEINVKTLAVLLAALMGISGTVMLFMFVKFVESFIKKFFKKIVLFIDNNTMVIYLVHEIFIFVSYKYLVGPDVSPVVAVFVSLIFGCVVTYFVTLLVNKSKILSIIFGSSFSPSFNKNILIKYSK